MRSPSPARLSPKRRASTIASRTGSPNERAQRLVDAIKAVLAEAIAAGGSSLRDHRRTDGELGDFQHNFRVYDRAGKSCPTQAAPARSGAWCKAADRHFIARCVSASKLEACEAPCTFRARAP